MGNVRSTLQRNTASNFQSDNSIVDAGQITAIDDVTPPRMKLGDGKQTYKNTPVLLTGTHESIAAAKTTEGKRIYGVDTTSGSVTVTIASTDIADVGSEYIIHDEGGAAGSNSIVVATEGSETINGAATVSIATNYNSVYLYSDGSNLFKLTGI